MSLWRRASVIAQQPIRLHGDPTSGLRSLTMSSAVTSSDRASNPLTQTWSKGKQYRWALAILTLSEAHDVEDALIDRYEKERDRATERDPARFDFDVRVSSLEKDLLYLRILPYAFVAGLNPGKNPKKPTDEDRNAGLKRVHAALVLLGWIGLDRRRSHIPGLSPAEPAASSSAGGGASTSADNGSRAGPRPNPATEIIFSFQLGNDRRQNPQLVEFLLSIIEEKTARKKEQRKQDEMKKEHEEDAAKAMEQFRKNSSALMGAKSEAGREMIEARKVQQRKSKFEEGQEKRADEKKIERRNDLHKLFNDRKNKKELPEQSWSDYGGGGKGGGGRGGDHRLDGDDDDDDSSGDGGG